MGWPTSAPERPAKWSNGAAVIALCAVVIVFLLHYYGWWYGPLRAAGWHLTHNAEIRAGVYDLEVPWGWTAARRNNGWEVSRGGYGSTPLRSLMFLHDPAAVRQRLPAAGWDGFHVPLAPVRVSLAGRDLTCAAFADSTNDAVIQRCVGADGMVVGALGPPDVLADLQRVTRGAAAAH